VTAQPRLAGKVAIVTGAGSEGTDYGTGAASAILMASHGARVAVVDLSQERAMHTVAAIEAAGGAVMSVVADLTSNDDCRRVAASVEARFGAPTVLVNNLGTTSGGSVVDIEEAIWDRLIAVNLTSVMLMSRHVIPRMAVAGGGAIVNVSSIASLRGFGSAAYAASKGGVNALTVDMAVAHGRQGIRVNCIAPGHLQTPMGALAGQQMRDLRRRASLLGTEGTAWDMAFAAVFLASDEAKYITAAVLPVDGGATAATVLAMLPHMTS
jgi:NAD(P)-dependent dehydrogenase (short-subunit alcohol dehydrogenase family)